MTNQIPEIGKLLTTLNAIASYIHFSSVRAHDLELISTANHLDLMKIPKIFKVRWSEYTYNVIRSIIVSWNALILFFRANPRDGTAVGFLAYLTKFETLKILFFMGDTMALFHRFHTKIQSDSLTIISLNSHVKSAISALNDLKAGPLLGGHEETFSGNLEKDGDNVRYISN